MHTMTKTVSLKSVAKGVATNKWMVVVATFFIMACAGATYNFGIYSQVMKLNLGYNQETVTTIGFFKDLGANVGIFSGLLYDATGPWVVLMCGAVLNMFGYLMIWLAVTRRIATPKIWHMCLYICIGANSQAFTNTGVIVTSVKNFQNNRGLVIGLLKGYVGLSGAMLTLLYKAIYGDHPASFILFIAWFPCLICLMFMFVIRQMPAGGPEEADSEKRIFNIFLVIALVLAGYLMLTIIVQHIKGVHIPQYGFQVLAVVMLLVVLLPLGVVVHEEIKKQKRDLLRNAEQGIQLGDNEAGVLKDEEKNTKTEDSHTEEFGGKAGDIQVSPVVPSGKKGNWWERERLKEIVWERPPRGSDFSILEAIFSIDMVLIFVATTCGVGGGLMAIDNLGQIGASLNYNQSQVDTFVALISIWNFLGRVSSGYVSDVVLRRYGVPRTFFFAAVMGIAAIGHLIIALNLPGALFAGSILIGLTFGAQWALMFTIISELFGLKYYGTLYNVGGVASPLGSYLLSVRVAGSLYDKEAKKQGGKVGKFLGRMMLGGHSDLLCHGARCFRTTFFIMAGVCILGCSIALVLTIRTFRFYKGIHLKMKQQRELQQ